jgi:hypothetical protein
MKIISVVGAGVLTGSDIVKVERAIGYFLTHPIHAQRPELWDGKTAERCLTAILNFR